MGTISSSELEDRKTPVDILTFLFLLGPIRKRIKNLLAVFRMQNMIALFKFQK